MGANREYWPWNTAVTTSVGPTRRRRIIQLRTVQQYDQAGGLPLTFWEIRKHRPAIKPAWLGQAGQGDHRHGELPRQELERLGDLASFPRRIMQRPGRLDHADLVDDHQP